MSGTIVPLIWQTYKKGVEKNDVSMRIGLAQNFVTSHSTKLCHRGVYLVSYPYTPYGISESYFPPKRRIHFWTNIFQEMKYFILFEPQS